ncbi:MAG: hypothetical protein O4859_16990, partial [Trichodesmium sp. St18_bin1]|nr:hypothetical protein [Trichodesmium sp. St18_bin1]
WLGTWEGTILQESAVWLRFLDSQGNLVLLPGEVAEQERQRAEQEQQRAERLAAKLRELGLDPDSV